MEISARQSSVIALLVAGALFMEQLDGTVIATALPQMANTFEVAPVDLNIGISAYLLTVAVFIPASGWVTDRFGARAVFASAIATFTIASILCAASGTLLAFTAARILQGIGGAMMVPVGRLIVLRNTEKPDLIRAIAFLTWPALTAPVVGPPLGGLITTYSSWPWIFLLNVPWDHRPRARAQPHSEFTRRSRLVRLARIPGHRLCELRPDVMLGRFLDLVRDIAGGRAARPGDDLETAVVVLDHRGAAFHPVAAIDVADAVIVVDDGVMDVTADDAVGGVPTRLGHQRLLELADEVHRVLDLQLGPLRQRPVGEAQPAAQRVEHAVGDDGEVVGLVAERGEPARLA